MARVKIELPPRVGKRVRNSVEYVPTKADQDRVLSLRGHEYSEADIARMIINPRTRKPIDLHTLKKYYQDELDIGFLVVREKVNNSTVRMAVGIETVFLRNEDGKIERDAHGKPIVITPGRAPSETAAIWWEKSRLGYKEGSVVEHTGKNGAPLPNEDRVVIILPANGRDQPFSIDQVPVLPIASPVQDAVTIVMPKKDSMSNGKANGHG